MGTRTRGRWRLSPELLSPYAVVTPALDLRARERKQQGDGSSWPGRSRDDRELQRAWPHKKNGKGRKRVATVRDKVRDFALTLPGAFADVP